MVRPTILSLSVALLATAELTTQAAVKLTVPEALELAFPTGEVTRTRRALSPAQQLRIRKSIKRPFDTALVRPYVAKTKAGKLIGTAYFDRHRVRSKDQVVMVVVSPTHKVERVEVLAFLEPQDYLPSPRWYAQLHGYPRQGQQGSKAVQPVTGSTLTVLATTRATDRVLAIHAELFPVACGVKAQPETRTSSRTTSKPTSRPTPDVRSKTIDESRSS